MIASFLLIWIVNIPGNVYGSFSVTFRILSSEVENELRNCQAFSHKVIYSLFALLFCQEYLSFFFLSYLPALELPEIQKIQLKFFVHLSMQFTIKRCVFDHPGASIWESRIVRPENAWHFCLRPFIFRCLETAKQYK